MFWAIVVAGCSSTAENTNTKNSEEAAPIAEQVEEPKAVKSPVVKADTLKYQFIDSLIRGDIQQLDKRYASTPFYTQISGRRYYVVCTGTWEYNIDRFGGKLKYGLINDSLEVILEPQFDKIYNPHLTVDGCVEVKKDSKLGLYNVGTGQILEPQFDYIMPASYRAGKTAYGIKDNTWYKINSEPAFTVTPASFSPVSLLQMLRFDVNHAGKNLMYDSYNNINREYDPLTGKGVVILPSYLEHLNLLSSDHYADIILADQSEEVDFGTTELKLKTDEEKTFYDKIKAFVVSSYEEGIDARGYAKNSSKLVVYNTENNNIISVSMGGGNQYFSLCSDYSYRFLNDSIIEVRSDSQGERYEYQTSYTFFKVTRQGEIIELKSSRQYNYTKFIIINEDYFKGCFASSISPEERSGSENMYMSEHLTIEDLDIMRNEIFAEYGYIFKSDKWKNYFAGRYTPLHENVDDQLTDIDKANIKTILKVRNAMENNEYEYTKKESIAYYPAG